jgi:hypothetical protein
VDGFSRASSLPGLILPAAIAVAPRVSAKKRLHRVVGRMPRRWHSGTSGGSVDTRSYAHLQLSKSKTPSNDGKSSVKKRESASKRAVVSEISIRRSRTISSAL